MDATQRFRELWERYINDQASDADFNELGNLLDQGIQPDWLEKEMLDRIQNNSVTYPWPEKRSAAVLEQILHPVAGNKPTLSGDWISRPKTITLPFRILRIAAAACIILLVGAGGYLAWHSFEARSSQNIKPDINHLKNNLSGDILPGSNKAILTLSGGQTIVLDSAANGLLAGTGETKSVRLVNGELDYPSGVSGSGLSASGSSKASSSVYHTMTTPRGGQYRLRLPDGTAVWLNAASSITYPTAFTGKERKVEVSGEAYFEVTKDASRPFRVWITSSVPYSSQPTIIEVLGTHFNINAYKDEKTLRATLLEGSIRVRHNDRSELLLPGQQAVLSEKGALGITDHADLSQTVSWKDGFFNFHKLGLQEVMRQISRWYKVEVVYEKNIPDLYFWGEMERGLPLSDVLDILGKMDVHFKIEGRTLIVKP